ncbi:MAG: hypothetical protein WBC63_07325 [Candidatus Bipolaricaulia bacterium]
MRRLLVLLLAATLVFAVGGMMAVYGGPGPAPNSGDGIPDGSGFDGSPGPFGPAPSAGDGSLDGSGMDAPYVLS